VKRETKGNLYAGVGILIVVLAATTYCAGSAHAPVLADEPLFEDSQPGECMTITEFKDAYPEINEKDALWLVGQCWER